MIPSPGSGKLPINLHYGMPRNRDSDAEPAKDRIKSTPAESRAALPMMDHREHGDFEDEARGGRKRGRRGRCRRLRPAGSKRRDDERNASRDFDAKPKNPAEDEISRRGEPQKRAPRRCAHLSSCTARANLASEVRVTQPRGETPTVYPASFAPKSQRSAVGRGDISSRGPPDDIYAWAQSRSIVRFIPRLLRLSLSLLARDAKRRAMFPRVNARENAMLFRTTR